MDWKSIVGNAVQSAYNKAEKFNGELDNMRNRASYMSDSELIRQLRNNSSTAAQMALKEEARRRGLIK